MKIKISLVLLSSFLGSLTLFAQTQTDLNIDDRGALETGSLGNLLVPSWLSKFFSVKLKRGE